MHTLEQDSAVQQVRDTLARLILDDATLDPKPGSNGRLHFNCPRCDDTDRKAWLQGYSWGCWKCSEAATKDRGEPLKSLAAKLGVDWPAGSGQRDPLETYAQERGFSETKLAKWGVSSADWRTKSGGTSKVLCCEYRGTQGELLRLRFRGRFNPEKGKALRWWDKNPETEEPRDPGGEGLYLYGLWHLAASPNKTAPVLLVEGESDCHACWHMGMACIGLPGGATWRAEWTPYLEGRQVYVWSEGDRTASRMVLSIAESIPSARVLASPDPKIKDPCAAFQAMGAERARGWLQELQRDALRVGQRPPSIYVDAMIGRALTSLVEQDRATNRGKVYSYFLPQYNAISRSGSGLLPGDYIVQGAAPSLGKTTLVVNQVAHATTAGRRVCVLPLEGADEANRAILSLETGVPIAALRPGKYMSVARQDEAVRLRHELYERTGGLLYMPRDTPRTSAEIMDVVEYAVSELGCEEVHVDYLQLCKLVDPDTGKRLRLSPTEATDELSDLLCRFAERHKVVTYATTQLSKTAMQTLDRSPDMDSFYGAGSARDAWVAMVMDHTRRWDCETPVPGRAGATLWGWDSVLRIVKNRGGRKTLDIPVRYEPYLGLMRQRTASEIRPEEEPGYRPPRRTAKSSARK